MWLLLADSFAQLDLRRCVLDAQIPVLRYMMQLPTFWCSFGQRVLELSVVQGRQSSSLPPRLRISRSMPLCITATAGFMYASIGETLLSSPEAALLGCAESMPKA